MIKEKQIRILFYRDYEYYRDNYYYFRIYKIITKCYYKIKGKHDDFYKYKIREL